LVDVTEIDGATLRARLRPLFDGKALVLTGQVAATYPPTLPLLAELGARRPLIVALNPGTGPQPDPAAADLLLVPLPATSIVDEVNVSNDFVADPPDFVRAAVDAYDPSAEAQVMVGPFATSRTFCGRRVLDGRLPSWAALENKAVVDNFWDGLGVAHAPSRVVAADQPALVTAARALDRGQGTVWSGDTSRGITGGAHAVRWVRGEDGARDAAQFLGANADRVRVMPFLDGVSCGIHGIVTPDGVAVLRPLEQVVLRRPSTGEFLYAGTSTWWDPPGSVREQMRRLVRKVGEALRTRVDYRGGFSIDGILTDDGFVPTELNARFAAGLGTVARGATDVPLRLIQVALVAGYDLGISAADLEGVLLPAADEHRSAGLLTVVERRCDETIERPVLFENGSARWAAADEESHGTIELGPSASGGLLHLTPGPSLVRPGQSVARHVVAAWALADQTWQLDIGPLEAANPVTSS
jgi:hypothetical protein